VIQKSVVNLLENRCKDEMQKNNIFFQSLEVKACETIELETNTVSKKNITKAKNLEQLLPDNCVMCEIQMPEANASGFIKVQQEGSVMAIIPFDFADLKARKNMDLKAHSYLHLEKLLQSISNSEIISLDGNNLEKQHQSQGYESAVNSAQLLEPYLNKIRIDCESIFGFDPLLSKVFQFIDKYYYQPITLCHVAQAVGYSSAYLTDLVRRQTGKTVNHWIIEYRMAAARTLLLETNRSVNQIASAVGYHNEGHFFRQFRQHHETTPLGWRKMHRSRRNVSKTLAC
jgi:AraC-like DNA-binding protein